MDGYTGGMFDVPQCSTESSCAEFTALTLGPPQKLCDLLSTPNHKLTNQIRSIRFHPLFELVRLELCYSSVNSTGEEIPDRFGR